MKRVLLFAVAAILSVTAHSQTVYDYIPLQGSIATEIQFNPFSNNFETFKLEQIKLRYMVTDMDALRFGLGFGFDSEKYTPNPEDHSDSYSKGTMGDFNINFGYERHFLQVSRVDLYAGAEIGFEKTFLSTKRVYDGELSSSTSNGDDENRVYSQFGCNVFTGIDFYVYRGLYIGAEFGLKCYMRTYPQYQYSYYNRDDLKVTEKEGGEDRVFHFGTYCVPALRVGWTF